MNQLNWRCYLAQFDQPVKLSLLLAPFCRSIKLLQYLFPAYGTCSVFGNAHFTTFDNKTYTYYSQCGHVLVDVAPNDNNKDPLEVVIMPDGFCDPINMCQKKLSLTIGGKAIVLGKRKADGTFSVTVDGTFLADSNLPYTDGEVSIEVREGEKLLFHVFIRSMFRLELVMLLV